MNNRQVSLQKKNQAPAKQKRKPAQASLIAQEANLQQALESPDTITPADLLKLQGEVGNATVGSWLSAHGLIQREPIADHNGMLNEQVSAAIQHSRGGGSVLPTTIRREMESALAADLGQVRLHTDVEADHLSRQLSAHAFTIGSDIFFKNGAYEPGTQRGRHTLHHELAHVLQQGGAAPGGRLKLGSPNTVEEQQAEHHASQTQTAGPAAIPTANAQGSVQRQLDMGRLMALLAMIQGGARQTMNGAGAVRDEIGETGASAGEKIGTATAAAFGTLGKGTDTAVDNGIADLGSVIGKNTVSELNRAGRGGASVASKIAGGARSVGQYMPLVGDRFADIPEDWDNEGGIMRVLARKTLGGNRDDWKKNPAASSANLLQSSLIWSLLSAGGGATSAIGALNAFGSGDYGVISQDAVIGTEAAGNSMADLATTIQAIGYMGNSGLNFYNMYKTRGYQQSVRNQATRQAGLEGGLSAFMGLTGFSNAGLGAAFTAQNVQAGGFRENEDHTLGIAKEAIAGGASAVSLGARGAKSGIALRRRNQMGTVAYYRGDNPGSYRCRDMEAAIFPRLKTLLIDAQTKKAKGQGWDMGKDALQTVGSALKSTGYGVGGTAGSVIKLAGTAAGIAGSVGSPLIKYFKDKYTERKVQKSLNSEGERYKSLTDYHQNRARTFDLGEGENGGTQTFTVTQVATDTNKVYDEFFRSQSSFPEATPAAIPNLSISRLLATTGEYQGVSTIFTTNNSNDRLEAIKNVILARNATF